jgi:hypothetical protein
MTKISHLLNSLALATTTVVSSLIYVQAAPAGAVNLVQNGDFQTGDLTSWTAGGPSMFVARGINGTPSALFVFGSNFISQTVSTNVGQNYSLSYDFHSEGNTPNRFQVDINGVTLFDQSDIPIKTPYFLPLANYSFNFVGTGSDTIRFTGITPFPDLQLDNVVVDNAASTSVPEPFTVIGTLVGGTAAIRMRKKLKLVRTKRC